MPVTIDPEYLRALLAAIALLVPVILILAGVMARRADLRLPRIGLRALQETLGLSGLPRPFFIGGLLLWLALLLILTTGIIAVIAGVIVRTLTLTGGQTDTLRTTLLSLAALTATLGALVALPFSTLRARNDARQTKASEDGLITDRINKAIEGLGAEKKVDRIGRPVTVWTGKPTQHSQGIMEEQDFVLPPRSRELMRGSTSFEWRDEDGQTRESYPTVITYDTWPTEETRIEWRDVSLLLSTDEVVASTGEWKVFSETLPNLEVRIGAILALERLARQYLDVHVQIMEILTAYIRENAKAKDAPKLPEPPEYRPDDPNGWKKAFWSWRESYPAAIEIRPRADIQMALEVIGRRTAAQRKVEARWQNPDSSAIFIFDEFPASFPEFATRDKAAYEDWKNRFSIWTEKLIAYEGYRIDLRRSNLRGAYLARLNLAGAQLQGAQLQGASLTMAQLQGASLAFVQMQGAELYSAQLQAAKLDCAQLQAAWLFEAQLQGASFKDAKLHGAALNGAQMQGANFDGALMEEAWLDGT